jgi:hypothetical protein
MEPKQNFGLPSIGIPFEVLFHPELSNTEKILYGFIRNLAQNEKGCFATNDWLGGLLGVKDWSISQGIANLKKYELIKVAYDKKKNRQLFINTDYPNIFKKIIIEGYGKITSSHVINQYPSIENSLGSYSLIKRVFKQDNQVEGKTEKIDLCRRVVLDNLPDEWLNDTSLLTSLDDWLVVRKEKRALPTERACTLTGKDLSKYSLDIAILALETAAKNGWTGVFPEKITNGRTLTTSRKQQVENQSPEQIIQSKVSGTYASIFYTYFENALGVMPGLSQAERIDLASNMVTLRRQLMRKQTDEASDHPDVPTPGNLVSDYTDWLGSQTWIRDKNPSLYNIEHTIFGKFISHISEALRVDVLTGSTHAHSFTE